MFPYSIDDVIWDGKDIKVMEQVTIRPPYLPENILGSPQADKAVNHVRKIVSKSYAAAVQNVSCTINLLFRWKNT